MNEAKAEFEVVIVDDNSPDGLVSYYFFKLKKLVIYLVFKFKNLNSTANVAKDLQKIYGENRIVIKGREKKLGLGK